MKSLGEHRRATEEHTYIRVGMFVSDAREDDVPVWSAEVSGCTEGGDGVLLSSDIGNDDVVHVVLLDLSRQVNVDLDAITRVLFLDGVQEGVEPFSCAEVPDNPSEVDLGEAGGLRIAEVIHAIPDGLQNGGEGSHTDTGTDEEDGFVVQEILGCGTEWTVHHDTRENPVKGRVRLRSDNLRSITTRLLVFLIEFAPESFRELGSEVAGDTDVN